MPYGDPLNLCSPCGKDFSSLEAFDRHRVGKHEYDFSFDHPDGRRCLEADDLQALGWEMDERGRWHDPERSTRARRAFQDRASDVGLTPQTPSEAVAGLMTHPPLFDEAA